MKDSWEMLRREFELEINDVDILDFRDHLRQSIGTSQKKLEKKIQDLSAEEFQSPDDFEQYKDHLSEIYMEEEETKTLGDELVIIALYKRIEIHTKKLVKNYIKSANPANVSYFDEFKKMLLPIDISTITKFNSFNELRLINNSIKHEGVVSKQLATNFPIWKEGAPLTDLNITFTRLHPEIKEYIYDLATKLQSKT